LLQHVSVYINHHQGAHSLCFAKVILISDFELPDDDLCKPKHVGAIIVVLKVFNNSTILE